MTEFEYKDYIPANARVIVNYNKDEKVKFSYPNKYTYWEAVWKCAFVVVIGFWVKVLMCVFFYMVMPIAIVYAIISAITTPTVHIPESTLIMSEQLKFSALLIGADLFLVLGIPLIITLILATNKERLTRWIPKLGKWGAMLLGSIHEKEFKKEDLEDNKAIIHAFKNVFLEYKASGDFSEKLERVEILEIPFTTYNTFLFFPFKSKRKKKNEFIFRAVFYFKGKPKDGGLKIEFI